MRVEAIGLFSSPTHIPKIEKSREVLAKERANRKIRKGEERFLEREENIRKMLPKWLGKNINILI